MNYLKIYNDIIIKAKNEDKDGKRSIGYFEKHHIQPKSLGGSNDENNLIKLTAREHFICHWLLVKIYKKGSIERYKMLCALWRMNNSGHLYQKEHYINARAYEKLRIKFAKSVGENISKSQSGIGNSQYGTKWYTNKLTGESKKFKELPSDNWIEGRNRFKYFFNITTNEVALLDKYNHSLDWIDIKYKDDYMPGKLDKNGHWKYNKMTEEEVEKRKMLILNSGVDLTKIGWLNKVAKILNVKRENIHYFIINKCPELKEKIYYRKRKTK